MCLIFCRDTEFESEKVYWKFICRPQTVIVLGGRTNGTNEQFVELMCISQNRWSTFFVITCAKYRLVLTEVTHSWAEKWENAENSILEWKWNRTKIERVEDRPNWISAFLPLSLSLPLSSLTRTNINSSQCLGEAVWGTMRGVCRGEDTRRIQARIITNKCICGHFISSRWLGLLLITKIFADTCGLHLGRVGVTPCSAFHLWTCLTSVMV